MNNGEQVNDHIEQDEHTDNIVEYDGTNTLIHDLFNVRMDDEDVLRTCVNPPLYFVSIFYRTHMLCKSSH